MLEVSLGVAIFSMIFGSSVIFMLKMQEMYQQIVTDRNMWMVISSTAGFVRRNGCLPYPSDGNGEEIEYPEDDGEWRTNWRKYTRGSVPWKALGIPEPYSRDGRGNPYVYVVDPTLCGRKKVESVPMGDPREAMDFREKASGHFIDLEGGPEEVLGNSEQLIDSIYPSSKQYSSYRAVRSYLEDCGYSTDTKTKCWDIASKIKDCKLSIYKNGRKVDEEKRYFIIRKHKKTLTAKKTEEAIQSTFASLEANAKDFFSIGDFLNPDTSEESPYRVDDFVAFALISYKDRSMSGKKGQPSAKRRDKAQEIGAYEQQDEQCSNDGADQRIKGQGRGDELKKSVNLPNVIHLDANPGDLIIFMYRFQFMDLIGGFGGRWSMEKDPTKLEQKCCSFDIVDI